VGHFILFGLTCGSTTADWVTALTSAGGNVTWSVLAGHSVFTTNGNTQTVFIGKVVTASSHTVTVTTNAGSPLIIAGGQEFSNTAGFAAVTLDASGTVDIASSGHFPSVTPTRASDLYWAYIYDSGTGTAGSTSGYVYSTDSIGNLKCYNLSCANSAQQPNIGDTGGTAGIGVMLYENTGTTASAGLAHGAGAALQVPSNARLASGTGTALQVPSPAGLATAVGAALQVPSPAGLAHGTGTAQQPSITEVVVVSAGLATAAGAALQVPSPAGLASAAGTAFLVNFSAPAGLATAVGTAFQVPSPAQLAHGTGTAFQVPSPAGLAHGTGTAQQPVVNTVSAGLAHAAGVALQVPSKAGLAAGAGTAFQVPSPARLAHGTGTAFAPLSYFGQFTAGLAPGTGSAGSPAFPVILPHWGVTFTDLGPSAVLTGNDFGGMLTTPAFGAALTLPVFGGNLLPVSPGATCTIADYGATLSVAGLGAVITGGTMQQATLTLSEFNDMTIDIAVTNNGSPFDLTDYNLNLLLKSAAGVPDDTALTFSSSGGSPAITITSASAGLAVAQLPNVDLDSESYTFYRLDVVNASSQQQTTVYGSIVWITL
jgi:hypothetical protein